MGLVFTSSILEWADLFGFYSHLVLGIFENYKTDIRELVKYKKK